MWRSLLRHRLWPAAGAAGITAFLAAVSDRSAPAIDMLFGSASATCHGQPWADLQPDERFGDINAESQPRKIPASASPVAVVGGHSGLMAHDGRVFKPLPPGPRGDMEASFYLKVNRDGRMHAPPATFMPRFYGLLEVEEEGGRRQRYVELEDLTAPYRRPCVMDVKMGVQAWDEDASVAKIHKEASKYPTQQRVGFRLTGMRVWDRRPALTKRPPAEEGEAERVAKLKNAGQDHGNGHVVMAVASTSPYYKVPEGYTFHPHGTYREHGRAFGYALDERTLEEGFREFLFDGTRVRVELIPSFLERLLAIREWMLEQGEHRFYGSSLLFIYEGEPPQHHHHHHQVGHAPLPVGVDVRMIDFAHAWPIAANNTTEATAHETAADGAIAKAKEVAWAPQSSLPHEAADDVRYFDSVNDAEGEEHEAAGATPTRVEEAAAAAVDVVTSEHRDTGYLLGLDSAVNYLVRVMERNNYNSSVAASGSGSGVDYRVLGEWYRLRVELQDAAAVARKTKAVLLPKGHHFHHLTAEQDEAALQYANNSSKAKSAPA